MSINWSYPSVLTSTRTEIPNDESPVGKIGTVTNNNADAIQMIGDHVPGQRPYNQDYGSKIRIVLQDTTNLSAAFVGAATDLKNVLAVYSKTKYIVTAISPVVDRLNPREVKITISFTPLI